MKCENCGTEHDGIYGSGRFCSSKCARGFSTKSKRSEINAKVSSSLKKMREEGKCQGSPFQSEDTRRKGKGKWTDEDREKARAIQIRKLEERYASVPFEDLPPDRRRKYVLTDQNNCCLACGIDSWNGKPIVIEIDHIDGNNSNNKRENLRGLCPNCHSQTPTWKGRIHGGKQKVTDDEIVKALVEHGSINKALQSLGLKWGGNAKRVHRLISRYNIIL